jgi:glycosyltransferase involved in cell wall biosynthesis
MQLSRSGPEIVPRAPGDPLRIGVFGNTANNAYIQAKVLRRLGQEADVVLDPLDHHVMSDPRWEELDLELPTDRDAGATLPAFQLPAWVRAEPPERTRQREGGYVSRYLADLRDAPRAWPSWWVAARRTGWRGGRSALEQSWVVKTLAGYDCVIAFGPGPAWAALAGVPFVALTWGGDITILPFYDTGDWEGHETVPLPEPHREYYAAARLQRMGYEQAARIVLADPRFAMFAERLGHAEKCVHLGLVIDTDRYAPGPEPELRAQLLGGRDGLIVFVPSRQDWFWKGSDRLLQGFAAATAGRDDVVLVCAGWGADLDRSRKLIAELGIAARVRLLPHAMSKGRLRRYFRACDIAADQFTVGSYGGSALEAMSCARPLLISLSPELFEGRFTVFPPVMNVSEPEQIAAALTRLFDDRDLRAQLGQQAREWIVDNHGQVLAQHVLDLCHAAVTEAAPRRTRRAE